MRRGWPSSVRGGQLTLPCGTSPSATLLGTRVQSLCTTPSVRRHWCQGTNNRKHEKAAESNCSKQVPLAAQYPLPSGCCWIGGTESYLKSQFNTECFGCLSCSPSPPCPEVLGMERTAAALTGLGTLCWNSTGSGCGNCHLSMPAEGISWGQGSTGQR